MVLIIKYLKQLYIDAIMLLMLYSISIRYRIFIQFNDCLLILINNFLYLNPLSWLHCRFISSFFLLLLFLFYLRFRLLLFGNFLLFTLFLHLVNHCRWIIFFLIIVIVIVIVDFSSIFLLFKDYIFDFIFQDPFLKE
jgi:hypothetical protein